MLHGRAEGDMEGIINVLKPPGMTSSNAVADVRHIFNMKRVGHTGTLDPGAAGVLPICLGRATRLFDYLVDKEKEYYAEIAFGSATDTQDSYGRVIARGKGEVSAQQLCAALPAFRGEIEQVAPMYSAVCADGKRLYQLARMGAEDVRKTRCVTVHALELVSQTAGNRFLLRVCCSRGTYVRTLCNDLGIALGVPAHLSFLLRTRSGAFCIEQAYSIAELQALKEAGRLETALVSVEKALSHLAEARLSGLSMRNAHLLENGAEIEHPALASMPEEEPLRVYANGKFLGIGLIAAGKLHITTFFGEDAQQHAE